MFTTVFTIALAISSNAVSLRESQIKKQIPAIENRITTLEAKIDSLELLMAKYGKAGDPKVLKIGDQLTLVQKQLVESRSDLRKAKKSLNQIQSLLKLKYKYTFSRYAAVTFRLLAFPGTSSLIDV